MGRKSKLKRINNSQSGTTTDMSSTPPFHTSNLTYAIRNANDTIYEPPTFLQSASPLNTNTQTPLPNQLGPHAHTSTQIHYNTMHTNTPQLDVNNGQGQGHTPQMLTLGQPDFSNLGLILNDIENKLTKLNLLDNIVDRLQHIEQRFNIVENDISQLKRSIMDQQKLIESNDEEMRHFHTRIREHEIACNELEEKIKQTHESFLDQQTRAMKYNLIFENIAQVIPDATTNENTEAVLKEFLKNEMNIDNQIAFHNVHRLKPRRDR